MERDEQVRQKISLRTLVMSVPWCAERFQQAENLAKSMFHEAPGRVVLPYFTEHSCKHSQTVERFLDEILFGGDPDPDSDFVPTPEEAMYLLSAAWLHDLGMLYGSDFSDNERPEDLANAPQKIVALRRIHEYRTSQYLTARWKWGSEAWDDEGKILLGNVCVFHRAIHEIHDFSPAIITSRHTGQQLRLRVLAALLRLADACHVDQSRAPGPLRSFYDSLGMPADSTCHWAKAELISNVRFDHVQRRIELVALIPQPLEFPLGRFDFAEVVELARNEVESDMLSVHSVLLEHPNTAFREVWVNPNPVEAIRHQKDERALGVWPYLLHRPTSATETAATLAQLLLCAVSKTSDYGAAWQLRMKAIMDEALRSRPFDFMIANLYREVGKLLAAIPADARSVEGLTKYLDAFLNSLESECDRTVNDARQTVSPEDALVVYGYSTSIAKFLKAVRSTLTGPLYVVECYQPPGARDLRCCEDERMVGLGRELGFKVHFLHLAGLTGTFKELKTANKRITVLLGTHGVSNDGQFLCKAGCGVLVMVARQFKAKIVAFSSPMKFLGQEQEVPPTGEGALGHMETDKLFPESGRIIYLQPAMDTISQSSVDWPKSVCAEGTPWPADEVQTKTKDT
jgi:hypothetical protein